MLLTTAQHQAIARRDIWRFDCYFGALSQDSVIFTGDGVDDLDRLIDRLIVNAANNRMPHQKFTCDVGTQYSDFQPFDIEDVIAIRAQYAIWYGETDKPNIYIESPSASLSIV